jgi:hypothetical protein
MSEREVDVLAEVIASLLMRVRADPTAVLRKVLDHVRQRDAKRSAMRLEAPPLIPNRDFVDFACLEERPPAFAADVDHLKSFLAYVLVRDITRNHSKEDAARIIFRIMKGVAPPALDGCTITSAACRA